VTAIEVKAIREELGLTQIAFAALLPVAENTVWRWENGRCRIPATTASLIRRIAAEAAIAVPA